MHFENISEASTFDHFNDQPKIKVDTFVDTIQYTTRQAFWLTKQDRSVCRLRNANCSAFN